MAQIVCGNREAHILWVAGHKIDHRHDSVAEVRDCFARPGYVLSDIELDDYADSQAVYEAENAYERHLEDRGWAEAAGQDAWEAARGVESFEAAWDRSDREQGIVTRPGRIAQLEAQGLAS